MGVSEHECPSPYFSECMKPLCELCKTRHESYQAHVFASNAASNKVTASSNASNGAVRVCASSEDRGVDEGVRIPSSGAVCGDGKTPKQRWSRDAYNAYQREYMRKKRSRKPASASTLAGSEDSPPSLKRGPALPI